MPVEWECRPFAGAWIETDTINPTFNKISVAPLQGRGLKPETKADAVLEDDVAPLQGRGLKQEASTRIFWRGESPLCRGVD